MRKISRAGRLLSAAALLCGTLLAGTLAATPAEAAITFTKSVDNPTPAPGENVTYTLRYTCSATDCANGTITDTLPAEMQFIGWTSDASTVDVAGSTVPTAGTAGGTMTIKLLDLTPGTTATVKVVLKYPNFTTANGTRSVNSATWTWTPAGWWTPCRPAPWWTPAARPGGRRTRPAATPGATTSASSGPATARRAAATPGSWWSTTPSPPSRTGPPRGTR